VLKVDFGVHVRGRILDSAFTLIWEPTYEKLVEAVKAATDTGVRVGHAPQSVFAFLADSCLRKQGSMCDWGSWVQQFKRQWNPTKSKSMARCSQVSRVFGGFIVLLMAFHRSVKTIENLSGHTISTYQVHGGGKSVPLVRTEDQTKMEEGEYFAIETFGSTGRGRIVECVSGTRCFIGVSLG
jgi:methionyl aminopeptidase